jgi:hypothetical protein
MTMPKHNFDGLEWRQIEPGLYEAEGHQVQRFRTGKYPWVVRQVNGGILCETYYLAEALDELRAHIGHGCACPPYLLRCGCPAQLVSDCGHQEGCGA